MQLAHPVEPDVDTLYYLTRWLSTPEGSIASRETFGLDIFTPRASAGRGCKLVGPRSSLMRADLEVIHVSSVKCRNKAGNEARVHFTTLVPLMRTRDAIAQFGETTPGSNIPLLKDELQGTVQGRGQWWSVPFLQYTSAECALTAVRNMLAQGPAPVATLAQVRDFAVGLKKGTIPEDVWARHAEPLHSEELGRDIYRYAAVGTPDKPVSGSICPLSYPTVEELRKEKWDPAHAVKTIDAVYAIPSAMSGTIGKCSMQRQPRFAGKGIVVIAANSAAEGDPNALWTNATQARQQPTAPGADSVA